MSERVVRGVFVRLFWRRENVKQSGHSKRQKLRSACASYQPRVSTATHLSSTLSLVIRKSRVTRAYEEALDLSEGALKACTVQSKMWLIDEGSHGLEQSDQPLALLE